jgi:membrane-associated phospholipid phosphatase
MAFLGGAIAISTVLLGIHWLADVIAGLALALITVKAAVAMNARFRSRG